EKAQHIQKQEDAVRDLLRQSREKLFAIRSKRPRPHLDDKIIAAWNGLMISAYARAAQILDEPRYLKRATLATNFVRTHLWDDSKKTLYRSYREGLGRVEGFADDYAFVIHGLLATLEASLDIE